jgi:hypothetical protein
MKIRARYLARPLIAVAVAALLTPGALASPTRLDRWGSDPRQSQNAAMPAPLGPHGTVQNTTSRATAALIEEHGPAQNGPLVPQTFRPTAVTIVEPRAFDWGDAGVGAAGTAGLMLLASGLLIVARHGRRAAA